MFCLLTLFIHHSNTCWLQEEEKVNAAFFTCCLAQGGAAAFLPRFLETPSNKKTACVTPHSRKYHRESSGCKRHGQ
jgi:hypothetical protein